MTRRKAVLVGFLVGIIFLILTALAIIYVYWFPRGEYLVHLYLPDGCRAINFRGVSESVIYMPAGDNILEIECGTQRFEAKITVVPTENYASWEKGEHRVSVTAEQ